MNNQHSLSNIVLQKTKDFVIDYYQRHAHPVNAVLHIIGVPLAFFGLYKLLTGSAIFGLTLLFFGYLFQYFGHQVQGNEVGEVTLIKKLYSKLSQKFRSKFTV